MTKFQKEIMCDLEKEYQLSEAERAENADILWWNSLTPKRRYDIMRSLIRKQRMYHKVQDFQRTGFTNDMRVEKYCNFLCLMLAKSEGGSYAVRNR